jgi:monovalent cation:H+ antiporter, CPA1 family
MALLDGIVAIGILLVIAIGTYLVTKKTPFLPYSIVLVLVGLVINSLQLPVFSGVELTPEILFYIFLPILLFESAYNLDLRMIRKDSVPITILATVGVVLSAFIVGWGMMYFLNIPFIAALLFASVIASTDPIAVIALFINTVG